MADLDPETAAVQIDVHPDPTGTRVVVLSGELDSSNADSVQERLASIAPQPAERLVFDLAGLQFMDSAGIAVLIGAASDAGSVSLRNPSPIVRRVLETTGLTKLFSVEP
jgi:stage II sporulation protein AA (anti-sigma F factor antagonist)